MNHKPSPIIRAIIFDLGGVLLRTPDFSPRERLAASLGYTRLELETLFFGGQSGTAAQLGEISTQQHWEFIRQTLGLTQSGFELFLEQFWGQDEMDYALVDVIRSLRPRCRTALLSNNFSDLRCWLVEKWAVADAFDELIISSEVGILKPDLLIYQLTLSRLGVQACEAVFVDDFLHNVEAAQALGMHAVHFRNSDQALTELGALLGGLA